MTILRVLWGRLRGLFGPELLEQRLEEELGAHLEMLVERNVASGRTPEEARRAAMVELGSLGVIREECREAAGIRWLEETLQDAGYALRLLRKRPGMTALVTLILSLGIGATTTVFSIRNSVFFRPEPYREPESLVLVGEAPLKDARSSASGWVRYSNFVDWRSRTSQLRNLAAWQVAPANVTLTAEPVRMLHERVSEHYFELLGVAPVLGRTFTAADFSLSAPPVVVLSHRAWQTDFGAQPGIIGRAIRVDGREATVVGVMPSQFRSPVLAGGGRFWMPLAGEEQARKQEEPTLQVAGRLRRGVSLESARAEMATIAARLAQEYPETNRDWGVRVDGMRERFSRAANTNASLALGIAAVLVFLITCANIANLLLARGIEREKEVALRAALGAGRRRLLRQFLVESLMLAVGGGLAGLGLAYFATSILSTAASPLVESIGIERFTIDGRALVSTLIVTLATALTFGLVSAFATSQFSIAPAMNEGSRTASGGRGKRRLTRLLIVSELTFAVMLLVSSVSLLGGLYRFNSLDWGFPTDHRLSMTVSLSRSTYPTTEHQMRFFEEALRRTAGLAGVRSVALTSVLPVDQAAAPVLPVKAEGVAAASGNGVANVTKAAFRLVSPDYLRTLSIPLQRGRMFNDQDRLGAAGIAIVNTSLASRLWKGGDAVGRRIEFNGQSLTVVGVARDVAFRNVVTGPAYPSYEVLLPLTQAPPASMTLIAHTAVAPAPMVKAIRDVLRSLDADQPVTNAYTLEGLRDELMRPVNVALNLLLLFGGSALLLATAGIYGVVSHSVSTRTREIGIRMAMGAAQSRVLTQVLCEGARLASLGALLGGAGAVLLTRVLANRVWWLEVPGLTALLAAGGLLIGVSLAGCYLPAWRASRVDPIAALRSE